jgi:hypothetical protein
VAERWVRRSRCKSHCCLAKREEASIEDSGLTVLRKIEREVGGKVAEDGYLTEEDREGCDRWRSTASWKIQWRKDHLCRIRMFKKWNELF